MKNLTKYAIIGLVLIPMLASAAVVGNAPTDLAGIWQKVTLFMQWVMAIFFLVATIFILMAGFKYLTAGGDTAKIDEAKHMLTYAIVGIAVGLLAFAIPEIVRSFLGVTLTAPAGGGAL
ncbi:MAG: hypothetical protein AAB920_00820 [Patescibacteria group bacterium]